MTKITFTIALLISFFGFQMNSCSPINNSNNEMIHTGPDKFTSLVVFFKKEATREEIENFYNHVISVPRPDRRGRNLPDGVALQYLVRNGDHEGVGMTFSTEATPEQREKLKKAIEESPIVYKVYENVVPNEIKDLPGAKKEEPNKTPDTRPIKEPTNSVINSNS